MLHAHGLCWLLVVPGLAPVSTVSLAQYAAAGVPARSLVVLLRGSVPERCWIDASLGVLPLVVSIELEIACPWLLVLQWHVEQLLWILDIALVPLRLLLWISSL